MPYAYGTVAAPVSTRLRQSLSLTLYSLHFQPVTDTATDTPPAGSGQGQGRVLGPVPYAYGTVAAPVSTRLRQSLSLTLYSLHFQPVTDTATDTPPAGSGQGQGRVLGPVPYAYGTVAAPVSTRLRQEPFSDSVFTPFSACHGYCHGYPTGRVWAGSGEGSGAVPYAYGTVAAPVSTRLRQSLSLTLYSLHFQPECRLGVTLAATRVVSECGELATDRSMDLSLQSCTLYRNAPRDFYAQLQH